MRNDIFDAQCKGWGFSPALRRLKRYWIGEIYSPSLFAVQLIKLDFSTDICMEATTNEIDKTVDIVFIYTKEYEDEVTQIIEKIDLLYQQFMKKTA